MFLAIVAASAATTDWESISPLLPSHSDKLPVVPDRASAEQLFGGINLGGGSPFAAFTIGSGSTTSLTNSRLDVAGLETLRRRQRRSHRRSCLSRVLSRSFDKSEYDLLIVRIESRAPRGAAGAGGQVDPRSFARLRSSQLLRASLKCGCTQLCRGVRGLYSDDYIDGSDEDRPLNSNGRIRVETSPDHRS